MTEREAGVAFLKHIVGMSPSSAPGAPRASKEDLKQAIRDLMSEDSSEVSSPHSGNST